MSRKPLPTVSAVLIVKNEEAVLDECLAALAWADEIVVYDTGSTDTTREIARQHTDRVVEGYWDDDFGAARTRALAHASSDWVIMVDADEVFRGDPAAMRGNLGRGGVASHTVVIEDVVARGRRAIVSHVMDRVFRRTEFEWRGQLHEQLVPLGGRRPRPSTALPGVRLMHSGYRADVKAAKGKATRNLEIARHDLETGLAAGVDPVRLAMLRANFARSLAGSGAVAEGLDVAEEAVADGALAAGALVTLARSMATHAHRAGDHAARDRWAARWQDAAGNPAWVWAFRASFAREDGDAAAVLDAMDHLPTTTVDRAQQRLDRAQLSAVEAWALLETGVPRRAVKVLLAAAAAGYLPAQPELVVRAFDAASADLADLARALRGEAWQALAFACAGAPGAGLRVLAAMNAIRPDDRTTLLCAARHAERMTVTEAMEWSAPLRRAGLAQACPLRAIAASPSVDPSTRVTAAAVAFGAYQDLDVLADLEAALSAVPAHEEAQLLALVEQVAPGLLTPAG